MIWFSSNVFLALKVSHSLQQAIPCLLQIQILYIVLNELLRILSREFLPKVNELVGLVKIVSYMVNSSDSATLSLIGFAFSQSMKTLSKASSSSYDDTLSLLATYDVKLLADDVDTLENILSECMHQLSIRLFTLRIDPSRILRTQCPCNHSLRLWNKVFCFQREAAIFLRSLKTTMSTCATIPHSCCVCVSYWPLPLLALPQLTPNRLDTFLKLILNY